MERVTPSAFASVIDTALSATRHRPIFGWGKPGVGKTSVVRQVADAAGVAFVDVRLGQLAPTDLRGIPVVDHENGSTRWYRPEFLPTAGEGILVLDEFNQAPPTMQGIAQQLLLARRLGEYQVPDGWMIMALGNRREDKASVYDMPSQVENRFKHYLVEESLDDWRAWATDAGVHPTIVAFLLYRPNLLHAFDPTGRAWPSPRTWEYASENHAVGQSIVACIGEAAAVEFYAFAETFEDIPNVDAILLGRSVKKAWSDEASRRFALVTALAWRATTAKKAIAALRFMMKNAGDEWIQLFMQHVVDTLDKVDELAPFAEHVTTDDRARVFLNRVTADAAV